MEYMSVREAAEKWGISQRYAQRYCTEGRIDGAVKFGGAWAIPSDAEKPADRRRTVGKTGSAADKKRTAAEGVFDKAERMILTEFAGGSAARADAAAPVAGSKGGLRVAMPLLNTPWSPGAAMESIVKMEDADTRNIALAEYYYFSGRSEKASDIVEEYLTHTDLALRLSACWLYAYANLALDRIPRTRQAMAQVKATVRAMDENTPAIYRAYAMCVAIGASVLLHLPVPESLGSIRDFLPSLPPGFRLFALYMQAHRAYLDGKYDVCIGISETALALESTLYPIPAIYLHLVSTMGYINLKQSKRARAHLLEAWKIAQPDDMIEPFGEHHGLLGGMLEAVLRKDYPDDFKRIIAITYSFSAGWRKIHNPDTGHHVADDLTTMEFTIAMLAARGWSNKEIGAHLGISTNTVKMHISSVLRQLGIPQRKDLAQFMLK